VMCVRSFLKLTMQMARQVFDGECRHPCNHNGSILVVNKRGCATTRPLTTDY
jgi:hypothetical protein